MEPTKRLKATLPPHYFAVQAAGVFALALGLISQLSNFRPAVVGIAPWLGVAWIAWAIVGLGIFVLIVNGARMIVHARRVKRST